MNETPSEREQTVQEQEQPTDPSSNAIYESSVLDGEGSFLPGQAAFSSTPATARHGTAQESFATQGTEDPSWTASIESPLIRLNREMASFSAHVDQSLPAPPSTQTRSLRGQSSSTSYSGPVETSNILPSGKGKAKDTSNPILRTVLRHNLYSTADVSSEVLKEVSPWKFRGKPKTPINKNLNPYLPPETSPAEWSGVVDLRNPSVLTPQSNRVLASKKPTTPFEIDDDDDSFIGLPPGMSPPVMMSPARPPRSSAELGLLKLGQTPSRDASARIKRDVLRDAQLGSGGQRSRLFNYDGGTSESSMSTVPTPPSLSRYARHFDYSASRSITKDSSLESMIRHIRNDMQPTPGVSTTPGLATTPGLRLRPRTQASSTMEPTPRGEVSDPATPVYENMLQDIDSDSDSLDEINNTAHPSAAFLMASQGGHPYDDDSFGSSNRSCDSLADEDIGTGIVPIHPFANVVEDDGFDDDDSFDGFVPAGGDLQEETVFGVTPHERERMHAEGLRMMGQELLEDTIGKGAQVAIGAEDSPTPASWAR